MPSFYEPHKRYGTSKLNLITTLGPGICFLFADTWRQHYGESCSELFNRLDINSVNEYFPKIRSYWPECGHGGETRVPWFLAPPPVEVKTVEVKTYKEIMKAGFMTAREYVIAWIRRQWSDKYIHAWN
jgi:hypothetical protein